MACLTRTQQGCFIKLGATNLYPGVLSGAGDQGCLWVVCLTAAC